MSVNSRGDAALTQWANGMKSFMGIVGSWACYQWWTIFLRDLAQSAHAGHRVQECLDMIQSMHNYVGSFPWAVDNEKMFRELMANDAWLIDTPGGVQPGCYRFPEASPLGLISPYAHVLKSEGIKGQFARYGSLENPK